MTEKTVSVRSLAKELNIKEEKILGILKSLEIITDSTDTDVSISEKMANILREFITKIPPR